MLHGTPSPYSSAMTRQNSSEMRNCTQSRFRPERWPDDNNRSEDAISTKGTLARQGGDRAILTRAGPSSEEVAKATSFLWALCATRSIQAVLHCDRWHCLADRAGSLTARA